MWKSVAPPPLLLALVLQCSGPAPGPPCTVNCSGTDRGYDAQSYELVGRFDWARQRLVATERVTLVKTAGSADIIELDAVVEVKRIYADSAGETEGGSADAGAANLPFTTAGNLLRIDLSSLHPGENPVSFLIDYEASPSGALRASVSRDDDPVTSRVVYTDSEPFDGMYWLLANHRPADRAAWKVELTVGATEDVIANGARTKDEMRDAERVVRYEMADPIPTYTMAFAAGELEHRDRTNGRVPISVWYRRGLTLEPDEMLELLTSAMASFETLVGPYRWASYAVVLLPEFSGGMENTSITFTTETSGQANPGASLQAHELAHQWFGDWVTVATFDDVWIKEGMATLLAPEADRAGRDAEGKGRLFGNTFGFNPADSIRDKALVGIAKYTSGPYTRAAWLLTQIRARVGEASFWHSLRTVLDKYALGSVDSEAFVRSFDLDEGTVQKILRALDERRVPAVAIDVRSTHGDASTTVVTLTLTDPGGTMIAPVTVTVVDGQGQPSPNTLVPDDPLSIFMPSGGYVALDEQGVHPDWWGSFAVASDEYAKLVPLLFPSTDAARATFATASAVHQERAFNALLGFGVSLTNPPASFSDLYQNLDSSAARRSAELEGCLTLKSHASSDWAPLLGPVLATPSLTTWSTGYANCETDLPTGLFGAEIAGLAPRVDAHTASRFVYLSSYDYGPAATLDALAPVATEGPSLQLREQALTRLSYQATPGFGYTAVSPEQLPRWKDFFRARLADSKSVARFQSVWRAVAGLNDDGALTVAAQKLHALAFSDDLQRQVVCDSYALANATRAEAWTEFQQAAQPWDTLSNAAQAALTAPATGCGP